MSSLQAVFEIALGSSSGSSFLLRMSVDEREQEVLESPPPAAPRADPGQGAWPDASDTPQSRELFDVDQR